MSFNVGFAEFFANDTGGSWPNRGSTQTWNVPANVWWVWVKAVAAGGAGGSTVKSTVLTAGAGGGGAGDSVEGMIIQVTPGGTLSIYVGNGGRYGWTGTTYSNVSRGFSGNAFVYTYPVESSGLDYDSEGGENTTIGPLVLAGGFGGSRGTVGHGGKGGGTGATYENSQITSQTNAGIRIPGSGASSPGQAGKRKESGRYYNGAGGGASAAATQPVAAPTQNWGTGNGGPDGPFLGGVEGTAQIVYSGADYGWATGGAGGAASIFGPGGDGANADADAPAIPTGSYGAGGGGGGGCSTTAGSTTAYKKGTNGANGYVSLHYLVANPSSYTLSAFTGSFTLTGKDVTFTYP